MIFENCCSGGGNVILGAETLWDVIFFEDCNVDIGTDIGIHDNLGCVERLCVMIHSVKSNVKKSLSVAAHSLFARSGGRTFPRRGSRGNIMYAGQSHIEGRKN